MYFWKNCYNNYKKYYNNSWVVDTAWQRAGERGGEFDSAYGVIRVPTRLQGGGQDQDAKDVLNHEYAHYLDAYVLGSPNITTKQLKGSGKNTQW